MPDVNANNIITQEVLIHDSDGNPVDIALDGTTNGLRIVDYEHHEIHAGSHYFVEDVADLAINHVFDLTFQTPDTAKWGHFTFELNCESECQWYIYEGVTVINPLSGTVTPRNNNRNSSNTSGMTLKSEDQADLATANNDTNVGAGTEIAHGIVGAGKDGGLITRNREIILKQNTVYCMRAIASAAGYVNFYMGWYEHTDIS